jgi:hypothetical protein
MPDFYSEPYLHLAGLSHKSALVTWGAFYFKTKSNAPEFKLVDDSDLGNVFPPRRQSIGAASEPYGSAVVTVRDRGGAIVTEAPTSTNHAWVTGLQPDTEYRYDVVVKGEVWADGERRDWNAVRKGLEQRGGRYENVFRTLPDPTAEVTEPICFAVIGDFGAGVRKPGSKQQEVADALNTVARQRDVRFIVTTGDNIYAQRKVFGLPIGGQGDEDDDWFFTFYQPYRYLLNRMPVYPSVGNHDTGETEEQDDRAQLMDNLYIEERIRPEIAAGRASLQPGLFYRFRVGAGIELIALDTSKDSLLSSDRLFLHRNHRQFLNEAFPRASGEPVWRIPFGHHPPFCAGPQHKSTSDFREPMDFGASGRASLLELFDRAGVRVALAGHEHNFQCSGVGSTLFVTTGAASKLRTGQPDSRDMTEAHTTGWAAECHFLLVTIHGKKMTLEPIAGVGEAGPRYVKAIGPANVALRMPIELELS